MQTRRRNIQCTHSLGLESVKGLELSAHVVGDGLEVLEDLLGLGNDVLVLEHLAVVGKVDVGALLLERGEGAASILVTLAESLER